MKYISVSGKQTRPVKANNKQKVNKKKKLPLISEILSGAWKMLQNSEVFDIWFISKNC